MLGNGSEAHIMADLHIFYPLTYFAELYNPDASEAAV